MGIINATPDSFSDGGLRLDPARAADDGAAMVAAGAAVLDIGGESTRPGAARVPAAQQIDRVCPVIERLRAGGVPALISIDTTLAAVADAALAVGAHAVNDVSGGADDPAMLPLCRERGCGVVLMHRLTTPPRDSFSTAYRNAPEYEGGVVAAVGGHMRTLLNRADNAGIDKEAVVLDPGLGFGKTVEQNAALVRETAALVAIGRPVLGAASRKSFVGRISGVPTERPAAERLAGSIAFSIAQLLGGVRLFRVHDVRAQTEALRAAWALLGSR